MSAQHTPGPWETSALSDGTEWTVCVSGGDIIADLALGDGRHAEANASLIAAAPDFYDVACALDLLLRQREEELGRLSPEMEAIAKSNRAAIAKARGDA